MGLPGMVLSGIVAVAGAIMYFALTAQNTAQNSGFRLSTVGVILMIAGAAGFVVSMFVFLMSRRSVAPIVTTIEQTTSNPVGDPIELHEERS